MKNFISIVSVTVLLLITAVDVFAVKIELGATTDSVGNCKGFGVSCGKVTWGTSKAIKADAIYMNGILTYTILEKDIPKEELSKLRRMSSLTLTEDTPIPASICKAVGLKDGSMYPKGVCKLERMGDSIVMRWHPICCKR